jgi:hypothetical protein
MLIGPEHEGLHTRRLVDHLQHLGLEVIGPDEAVEPTVEVGHGVARHVIDPLPANEIERPAVERGEGTVKHAVVFRQRVGGWTGSASARHVPRHGAKQRVKNGGPKPPFCRSREQGSCRTRARSYLGRPAGWPLIRGWRRDLYLMLSGVYQAVTWLKRVMAPADARNAHLDSRHPRDTAHVRVAGATGFSGLWVAPA